MDCLQSEIMKSGLCQAPAVPAHESEVYFLEASMRLVCRLLPDASGLFPVRGKILVSLPPALFADQSTPREGLGRFRFIDTIP
jgi:hypothetical protein